jgi:hypothetical protein
MTFVLKESLRETPIKHHDHLVYSIAYMVADLEARMRDEYCLMYIKQRPWWIPDVLYRWILRQVLCLAIFSGSFYQ